MASGPALRLDSASVRRGGREILIDITWTVERSQRWVVLGPNGSGKTSLLQLATGHLHPTSGTVDILGSRVGRIDVRQLRTRIGLVSGSVSRLLRPQLTAFEVVVTGMHAALEPWWHWYSNTDSERAHDLLDRAGLAGAASRPYGVLSEGERQQVLLARAVMGDPELLVFDEPAAGLDLGARERLVLRLQEIASDPSSPPTLFVTHHVEEIPPGFGDVLLLSQGRICAAGPIAEVLTHTNLTTTFGIEVELHQVSNRYWAQAKLHR